SSHPLRQLATRELQQSERSLALDRKLAAILRRHEEPADDAERLELAQLCQRPFKRLYAAACRFYADAFARDSPLAADLKVQHRYNAACAAVLAGAGKGRDESAPDAAARARLRRQAREWLRADLAAYANLLDQDPAAREPIRKRLRHWQSDPDLASV